MQAIVKGSSQDKVRCTASANPRPDITWVKDGVPLDTQRYAADNNGITIKGMSREDDAGEYEVMATVMETGQLERRVIRVEVGQPLDSTRIIRLACLVRRILIVVSPRSLF